MPSTLPFTDDTGLSEQQKRDKRDEELLLALLLWGDDANDSEIPPWGKTSPAAVAPAYIGLLSGSGWEFVPESQSWVSSSGTTLRSAAIANLVDGFAVAVEIELENATKAMVDDLGQHGHPLPTVGAVSKMSNDAAILLGDWEAYMLDLIQAEIVASAAVGAGGIDNLTDADWTAIDAAVADATTRLDGFKGAIADGTISESAAVARSGLYAHAAFPLYIAVKRNAFIANAGTDEAGNAIELQERSVLEIGVEHCQSSKGIPGCIEEAAKGWVKMGTLTPIGQRVCNQNDRCHWEGRVKPRST